MGFHSLLNWMENRKAAAEFCSHLHSDHCRALRFEECTEARGSVDKGSTGELWDGCVVGCRKLFSCPDDGCVGPL